jgi:hypothetical protein
MPKHKFPFCLFMLFSFFNHYGQFGPVQIIDNTLNLRNLTEIITADLNNDGFRDVIFSQAGITSKIVYYLNNGDGSFSSGNQLNGTAFSFNSISAGDFNNDGWFDLITTTFDANQVLIYINLAGSGFELPVEVSTEPLLYRDTVVDDFDNDGLTDFVVIADIDALFFRNTGNSTFSQTYFNNPHSTEYYSLDMADFNGDGDNDIVFGTFTLDMFAYIGNQSFTFFERFNNNTLGFATHATDIDNDGDADVLHLGSNRLWLSRNSGDGNLITEGPIDELVIHSIHSIDANGDGHKDLFIPANDKLVWVPNDGNGGLMTSQLIFEDSNFFGFQGAIADLNNDAIDDIIWSADSLDSQIPTMIVYQLGGATLGSNVENITEITIYPNPVSDILKINFDRNDIQRINIMSVSGQILKTISESVSDIDVSSLSSGIYLLEIISKNGRHIQKFIKK